MVRLRVRQSVGESTFLDSPVLSEVPEGENNDGLGIGVIGYSGIR